MASKKDILEILLGYDEKDTIRKNKEFIENLLGNKSEMDDIPDVIRDIIFSYSDLSKSAPNDDTINAINNITHKSYTELSKYFEDETYKNLNEKYETCKELYDGDLKGVYDDGYIYGSGIGDYEQNDEEKKRKENDDDIIQDYINTYEPSNEMGALLLGATLGDNFKESFLKNVVKYDESGKKIKKEKKKKNKKR